MKFFSMLLLVPSSFFGQITPIAVEDEIFTYDNINATGSLAENDLNPSGSILTYQLMGSTTFGDLTILENGSWTFNPYPEVAAVNQLLQYQVCDQFGQCDIGDVWLYVQFQNNAPLAENDQLYVEIDEPRFGDVSVNDYDPDYLSDPISTINSYEVLAPPLHGDVIFNLDGTFQYTPDPGYTGSDSFTYINCDACAVCDWATVFITVIPQNAEPIANNSVLLSLNEDTFYTGSAASLTSDPENDNLIHSVLSQPEHGTVIMNQDGAFIYTPDTDYSGSDEFMYLVCDIVGQCSVGFVYFNVINQNDTPVTLPSYYLTNEDFPAFNGNASTGDSDDTGVITYSLISQPLNGNAAMTSNGAFTYSPDNNFFGYDTLFISACDINGACASDFVYFEITPLNDWPEAIPDDYFGYEDEILTGTLANDVDVDGDILTYSLITPGQGGNITVSANGDFTFTPNQNFSGFSITTYQVCDPNNACSESTLTLEIIEINDDPIINQDFYLGNEDESVAGNVFTNDIEPDGEIIYYFTTTLPEHGVIQFNANGTFVYTPDSNWSGLDTIEFYGCDPCAVCLSSSLIIEIIPVNDYPEVSPANYASNEDIVLSSNLAIYVSDLDDNNFTFILANNAQNGTVVVQPNGNFTFTPDLNFNGADAFTYTVCDGQNACTNGEVSINLTAVNDSPAALGGIFDTDEDITLNGNLFNDYDVDGDALVFSVISPPMNGSIDLQQNGQFSYAPDENYHGVDLITYEVCDGDVLCDAGTIEININPVNDAPAEVNASNVTYQNEILTGDLSIQIMDPDGDDLTFSLINSTSNGAIVLNENGTYTYNPYLNFSGSDEATFEVCDAFNACSVGTLSITIFTTNTAPIASEVLEEIQEDQMISDNLSAYVIDNEGGVLTFEVTNPPLHGILNLQANGNFIYTPNANYFGQDSFSFQVCDTGNMCDEGQVDIVIESVNDSPSVFNESMTLNEDNQISGEVSMNDSDADGDVLSYSLITGTLNGTFELQPNGEFYFAPLENYYGEFVVAYNVCDNNNACTTGYIDLTVISINDGPVTQDGAQNINEDQIGSGNLEALVTDFDDEVHLFSLITPPANGTIDLNPNGQFSYTPDLDYNGTDSFVYHACDDDNFCSSGVYSFNVASVNDAPQAFDDFRTINEDHTTNGNVGLNDVDADDDDLFFTQLSAAVYGTIEFDIEGNFAYTPFANEWGIEEIMIQVCDETGICDTSYLNIQINAVNDSPEASGVVAETNEDILIIGNLNEYVSDVDNDEIYFTLEGDAQLGVMSLATDGGYIYTPNTNSHGSETLFYTACDEAGQCGEAQITIVISPINDAPVAVGESIHVLEDSIEENSVAGNDDDVDEDALTYVLISGPSFGEFSFESNGDFVYTPQTDYWGPDEVIYQVCDPGNLCSQAVLSIEVDFVNDAPIIVNESVQVLMNQSTSGTVAQNDIELDDEILTYFIYDDNSNGIFTLHEDGAFEYTPYPDVTGTFTLTYYACDPCAVCGEGTITLYVVPEKEANSPPTAENLNTDICHGQAVDINMFELVQDDEESTAGLIFEFSEVTSGSIQFDVETKTLTYQSYIENDDPVTISYTVCDNGLVPMCGEGEIVVQILPDIEPLLTDTTITNILCFGQSNGSIEISVTGPIGMEYNWSNADDSEDIENLSAGEYTVTINGPGDCFVEKTFDFEVTQPAAPLQASIVALNNINDNSNGSVSIEIIGGTAPYNVIWIGPGGYFSEEEDIVNLTNQGTYAASITDANGCSSSVNTGITGVENVSHPFSVMLSPNPCRNELNIVLNDMSADNAFYRLFDAAGQLVMSGNILRYQSTVQLQNVASGCYWITIGNDRGEKTLPFIKQ